MMTLIQAISRAVSVPGRICSHMSAIFAISVCRGSMTINLASGFWLRHFCIGRRRTGFDAV